MDRPALQGLLADIEARKVDTVVVYKVDRLTRSLADFAKIVEVFDGQCVAFVSVTQQFNTTTSMGRLTLNMLLSFAQFEREVTGERIRDKIAASKKKGLWMGGVVPLGYDAAARKLVINEAEADTVRSLFRLYLELGTVRRLKDEADRLDIVTKRRRQQNGRETGGRPFTRGNLYLLLSNPIYIGRIRHKGETYPGQHLPIIDEETWEKIQDRLARHAVKRTCRTNAKTPSLLTGLVFDETGDRLCPTHASKNGRRYRYYISKRLIHDADRHHDGWRLPATRLERAVLLAISEFLTDELCVSDMLRPGETSPSGIRKAGERAGALSNTFASGSPAEQRILLRQLIERISINPDHLSIHVKRSQLLGLLLDGPIDDSADGQAIALRFPVSFRRRGVEAKLILGRQDGPDTPDRKLVDAVTSACDWRERLLTGEAASINDLAGQVRRHPSDITRTIPLAFLAPDIVEAILQGRHPFGFTVERLLRCRLPVCWEQQRRLLGFTPSA